MQPQLLWRRLSLADREVAQNLLKNCCSLDNVSLPPENFSAWDSFFKQENNQSPEAWGLELKGSLAGLAILAQDSQNSNLLKLEIWCLSPGQRGIGLGEWMLEQIKIRARELNRRELACKLRANLSAAAILLHGAGFRPVGKQNNSPESGQTPLELTDIDGIWHFPPKKDL